MLNNYLSLAKKSKGELKIVNIKDIIKSVVELIQLRARKQNTEIIFEDHSNNSFVNVDQSRIQQVLLNIIINGLHAVEHGGKIFLKSYVFDHNVVIEIKDNGKGIPEENIERLFEPFFTTKKGWDRYGISYIKTDY